MFDWLGRINLFWTFIVLLVFHLLLYYSLDTDNLFGVALLASFVDTAIVGVLQYVFRAEKRRAR